MPSGSTSRSKRSANASLAFRVVSRGSCVAWRRPLHVADHGLGARLTDIGELPDEDRAALLNVLDALVTKHRLKTLAGGIN
jgi:hypothetical protein